MLTRRPASLAMCKLKNSYAANDCLSAIHSPCNIPLEVGALTSAKVLHTACGAYNPGDSCSIGMDGAVQRVFTAAYIAH